MDDHTIYGFVNELEKIGGLISKALVGTAAKAVEHPGAAVWRYQQQKKGLSKHKQTMLALKHGYPAGWVSMGIRPR